MHEEKPEQLRPWWTPIAGTSLSEAEAANKGERHDEGDADDDCEDEEGDTGGGTGTVEEDDAELTETVFLDAREEL